MKYLTHIISLPRCRTAWLSVALTQGPDSYAFHDGCGDHSDNSILSVEAYVEKVLARPERCITDSSSGIPSLPDHLSVSQGPIIVIEPDDEMRCRDGWISHLQQPGLLEQWPSLLANFCRCQDHFSDRIALRVPFHSITEAMPDIWRLCCPGVPFDHQRIADLARLNINELT